MKILLIGATGVIGSELAKAFSQHELYQASRNSTDWEVNIEDKGSIDALFQRLPQVDAVINAAGDAVWKSFAELTTDDFRKGINSKLMGQVNLVLVAQKYLKPNGSITLTTGILAEHFEAEGVALSLVNGALNSFVQAAAPQLQNGIRLNVVAPGAVEGHISENETFAGHHSVPFTRVIAAYAQSLNTNINGQIFRVY